MNCFCSDTASGTSVLDSLPTLTTGATSLITATQGEAAQLPTGSYQVSGAAVPIQTRPPINWLPVLLVGGGLIAISVLMSRNRK